MIASRSLRGLRSIRLEAGLKRDDCLDGEHTPHPKPRGARSPRDPPPALAARRTSAHAPRQPRGCRRSVSGVVGFVRGLSEGAEKKGSSKLGMGRAWGVRGRTGGRVRPAAGRVSVRTGALGCGLVCRACVPAARVRAGRVVIRVRAESSALQGSGSPAGGRGFGAPGVPKRTGPRRRGPPTGPLTPPRPPCARDPCGTLSPPPRPACASARPGGGARPGRRNDIGQRLVVRPMRCMQGASIPQGDGARQNGPAPKAWHPLARASRSQSRPRPRPPPPVPCAPRRPRQTPPSLPRAPPSPGPGPPAPSGARPRAACPGGGPR